MTAERCLACGATAVRERIEPLTMAEGVRTPILQDDRMVCAACGAIGYAGSQISAQARAVAGADHAAILRDKVGETVDLRRDYGEIRMNAFGLVAGRLFVCTYTVRGDARRVISV